MRKRIKVEHPVATTSENQTKKNMAYQARHKMLDEIAKLEPSKDGMPRYYIRMFGKWEEIPASQVHIYVDAEFEVVQK